MAMTAPARPRFAGSAQPLAASRHYASGSHATACKRIYANDNYCVWHSDFRQLLSYCRAGGGASRAIARLLSPQRNDIAVVKPRHLAFYETPLQVLLQQLKARELIITGVSTELCVLF